MLVYVLLVLLLACCYVRLPTSFLPSEDQGFVIANMELPSGSTANRTMDTIQDVENYFLNQPQVDNMVAVRGFSFNGNGLNAGLAFITLKDFSERRGPGDSAQAIADKAMGQLRSEEHTSELQSRGQLVCRLLLEK